MLQLPANFSEWLSLDWFRPATLLGFEWARPFYLYLLVSVPLLFMLRNFLKLRFQRKTDIAFIQSQALNQLSAKLRILPDILLAVVLILVLLSLARPQRTTEHVDQFAEGIDIMLVLDTSGSMELKDFKPNRLEAA